MATISHINYIILIKHILLYNKTQKNNRWIKNMQETNITDKETQDQNTF